MSGGHFGYVGTKIKDNLLTIAGDVYVDRRFPKLAQLFDDLGAIFEAVEHEIDWDMCGDSMIEDDEAFEREALMKLLEACMKAAPDDLFPRGKWATIQAVQARHEQT